MPAQSKSQQRFFGMVHAMQQGKLKTADMPASLVDKVEKTAASISDDAATEFAATPTKKLPKHVKESFSQFLIRTTDSEQ